MIAVDVRDLRKGDRSALAKYLHSKLQIKVKVDGKKLIAGDPEMRVRKKDLKVHLKTFLHRKGYFKEYKVTVDRKLVKVSKIPVRKGRKARREGLTPHPADTMPWYYPWKI